MSKKPKPKADEGRVFTKSDFEEALQKVVLRPVDVKGDDQKPEE